MPTDHGPDTTATSVRSRRIGKALIGFAMAVLSLLMLAGSFFLWRIYFSHKSNPEIMVASFREDYQESKPKPGWRYLWNPAGEIGKTNHHVDLVWNGVSYGPNASPERPQPGPQPTTSK